MSSRTFTLVSQETLKVSGSADVVGIVELSTGAPGAALRTAATKPALTRSAVVNLRDMVKPWNQEIPPMSRRILTVCASFGYLFITLFFAALLIAHWIPPMAPNWPAQRVAAFFTDHANSIRRPASW